MDIFLRILKEIGIAIVALILVSLIVWLLFRGHLPFLGRDIPDPVDYVQINKSDYDIKGDIEDETNPTLTYEATDGQLDGLESGRYVSTGGPNPFTSNSSESDVPSEMVTITNTANGNTEGTVGNTTTTTENGASTSSSSEKSLE